MESFIVRIYRRNSQAIIGKVEIVGKRQEKAFHTAQELLAILSSPRFQKSASARKFQKAAAPFAAIDDKGETS